MKKTISVLMAVAIIMGIITGCSGNSHYTSTPTPTATENPFKSGYYTNLNGEQAYVIVGKLSHIVINCTYSFVPWENRYSVPKDEIQSYIVVISPIEGENFSIIIDKAKLEQVKKFTEPMGEYFRIYLDEPGGILLKGPEWIY